MNYDQNDCPIVFFHNIFLTLADTLKTKVGDVVGCIFEVECTVGGFLILKQIIVLFGVSGFYYFTVSVYELAFFIILELILR
jgi:hypothetical protein